MVSVQIIFLTKAHPNAAPDALQYEEKVGPKLALARIPCAEEEVVIPEAGEKLGFGELHRVMFVRHLAERVPLFAHDRDEWPPRAQIGVIEA